MANSVGLGNNFSTTSAGPRGRARVGGSAFTVFAWDNQPILFARQISHQSPAAVGPGTTPIHPMDTPYPVELITAQATTMGTVTLELYELYGSNVWERLRTLGRSDGQGPVDLAGIFQAVAARNKPVRIFKYIRPPRLGGGNMKPYTEEYNNCVVSQLVDGETIEVGTMEILKTMVINYTHITRGGRNELLRKSNLGNQRDSHATPPTTY